MEIKSFFDPATSTMTYVVFDAQSKDAVIIDPVLDFEPADMTLATKSIDLLMAFVGEHKLKIHYILETHVHADHLSGARELIQQALPHAVIAISERITEVQAIFKKVFNFPESFRTDGSQFGRLLKDGETIAAGTIEVKIMATPGHTPACVSFHIGDALFTGDALFIPDSGTGRCDFPGGNAKALFNSISRRIYQLPLQTRIFVGHDYQPNGRELRFQTSVEESRTKNIQLRAETTEAEYIAFRSARDKTLSAPKLLFPSVQINMAAGHYPPAESNGKVYLKFPLTRLREQ